MSTVLSQALTSSASVIGQNGLQGGRRLHLTEGTGHQLAESAGPFPRPTFNYMSLFNRMGQFSCSQFFSNTSLPIHFGFLPPFSLTQILANAKSHIG